MLQRGTWSQLVIIKIFLLNTAPYYKVGFSWLATRTPSINKNVILFKCYTYLRTYCPGIICSMYLFYNLVLKLNNMGRARSKKYQSWAIWIGHTNWHTDWLSNLYYPLDVEKKNDYSLSTNIMHLVKCHDFITPKFGHTITTGPRV